MSGAGNITGEYYRGKYEFIVMQLFHSLLLAPPSLFTERKCLDQLIDKGY